MPPFENYKKWCTDNPDRFQQAQDMHQSIYGTTLPDIRAKLRALETWLVANGHKKTANKRDWFRFVLNWLKPKEWQKPVEPRREAIPEDKPRRSGVSNYSPQAVGNLLGRVFRTDSILVTPQTTKPQTLAQAEATGQQLPPIRVLTNKCQNCNQDRVPALYPFGGKMVCALCYAKATG